MMSPVSAVDVPRAGLLTVDFLTPLGVDEREALNLAFRDGNWPLLAADWTAACVASDLDHVNARHLVAREGGRERNFNRGRSTIRRTCGAIADLASTVRGGGVPCLSHGRRERGTRGGGGVQGRRSPR